MKRVIFTLSMLAMVISVMAGGIVTNTNQSAAFIRMPAQDATIGIDAVYYNPAGLTKLKDGFHLSLSNQYISQQRTVRSTFLSDPGAVHTMNQYEFEGSVTAPLFPSVYAVYKKNRFAFSLGFNPVGGGGTADFAEGLPSFEEQVAVIPLMLSAGGIPTTSYSMTSEFEGSSVFYGFQGGISYKVNNEFSLSVGARYVSISNSYKGNLLNVMINPVLADIGYNGSMVSASTFFGDLSPWLAGWSQQFGEASQGFQLLVDKGFGDIPLDQAPMLDPKQVAMIQAAIIRFGGDPTGFTIQDTQQWFANQSEATMVSSQQAAENAVRTQDNYVDATQSGNGITPIIGFHLQFSEKFSMAMKYEFQTPIKVQNSTTVDDPGLYPDQAEIPSDMPALLAVGLRYTPSNRVGINGGFHYYFDRAANYGRTLYGEFVPNDRLIGSDFFELALGIEVGLSDKFMLSVGGLRAQTGVKEDFQTDFSHSLNSNSLGGGLRFNFTDNIGLNLGAMNTWYEEGKREILMDVGSQVLNYRHFYNRSAFVVALGLDISF